MAGPSGANCLHVKPTYNQNRENGRHNSGGRVHKELRHKLILLSGDLPAACLSCLPQSRKPYKILPAWAGWALTGMGGNPVGCGRVAHPRRPHENEEGAAFYAFFCIFSLKKYIIFCILETTVRRIEKQTGVKLL
jgi:hypothetical protein